MHRSLEPGVALTNSTSVPSVCDLRPLVDDWGEEHETAKEPNEVELRKRTQSLTVRCFFFIVFIYLAWRASMIELNPVLKLCVAADTGQNASTHTFVCTECGHTVCEHVMCVPSSPGTVWTQCPTLHQSTFPKIYPGQWQHAAGALTFYLNEVYFIVLFLPCTVCTTP